eukprot:Skav232888  [mRNA]  locus=scaffold5953:23405:37191:- [translate_table: standard]
MARSAAARFIAQRQPRTRGPQGKQVFLGITLALVAFRALNFVCPPKATTGARVTAPSQLKSADPAAPVAVAPVEETTGGSTPMMMTSLTAMPLMYIAANKGDVRAEVTTVVLPVLAALAGWLAVMYGIQHALIELPFLTGNQYEYFPIIATFIAGYAVIVLEEQTEINKAATALVLGVLVWALVGTGVDMSAANFDTAIKETLEDVSEGAAQAIQAKTQKELLIIIGVLTFVLSSVLNNLTVDEDFRMKLGGLVVVASNAGGAWTPIGDITTTMLYIGGQVTTVPLLANLFIPSVLCLVGTLGYEYERDPGAAEDGETPNGQAVVFWGGLFGMITVPVFTALTQCPAWSGMMLVLGLLGLITSLLHGPEDEQGPQWDCCWIPVPCHCQVPDALFFLGVLFAVGGLERVGLLKEFAVQLSALVPYDALVAIFLGFASAVVDNVPLVAAAQGMFLGCAAGGTSSMRTLHLGGKGGPFKGAGVHQWEPTANDGLWNLITYCAATGGSLLVIGSAAGVAFMGALAGGAPGVGREAVVRCHGKHQVNQG